MACSIAASAGATAASSSVRSAIIRSLGLVPSGRAKPRSVTSPTFRSVAIATSATTTPGDVEPARLTCMSVTESW